MNEDIRAYAKVKKVKLWQIADALGISDAQLSRKMRYELDVSSKREIMEHIDRIVARRQSA
ncbi:MAG: hypothetical protein IK152_08875 [Lachnospiraceae bacterium]|nr:hypothetical protein [Lachnospiraceae bacterium]